MRAEELLFFDGFSQVLPLYEALRQQIMGRWPDAVIRVQKTQISFDNRHLFACVYLPLRHPRGGAYPYLGVVLGLGRALESDRVKACAAPYPGRYSHHFYLTDPGQIDEEWLGWLEEAYQFAWNKR